MALPHSSLTLKYSYAIKPVLPNPRPINKYIEAIPTMIVLAAQYIRWISSTHHKAELTWHEHIAGWAASYFSQSILRIPFVHHESEFKPRTCYRSPYFIIYPNTKLKYYNIKSKYLPYTSIFWAKTQALLTGTILSAWSSLQTIINFDLHREKTCSFSCPSMNWEKTTRIGIS